MFVINRHCPHKGFTLIEVLVALSLFAVVLLGLAGLQAAALKMGHQTRAQAHAAQLATQLLHCLQISRDATQQAEEIQQWKMRVNTQLPQGEGRVVQGRPTVITITWREKTAPNQQARYVLEGAP